MLTTDSPSIARLRFWTAPGADVMTVKCADLGELLAAYDALRQSYDERGVIIERLCGGASQPHASSTTPGIVTVHLCANPNCEWPA